MPLAKNEPDDRNMLGVQGWLALRTMALVAERIDGEVTNRTMVAELDTKEPVDLLGLLEWIPAGAGPGEFEHLANGQLYKGEVKDREQVLTDPDPVDGFALSGLE